MRRYEHRHPGGLVHVHIKNLGRIPDGGGWRTQGTSRARRTPGTTTTARRASHPVLSYAYIHTAIDDHSGLAYTEILPDEQAATAADFWWRAHAWFINWSITVRAVLTDNGSCYRSRDFAAALDTTGATHRRTLPYRPQANCEGVDVLLQGPDP